MLKNDCSQEAKEIWVRRELSLVYRGFGEEVKLED